MKEIVPSPLVCLPVMHGYVRAHVVCLLLAGCRIRSVAYKLVCEKMGKHKSGAQKRKDQEQRKNVVASCVPLTNFFRSTQVQPSNSATPSQSAATSRAASLSDERGGEGADSGEDELEDTAQPSASTTSSLNEREVEAGNGDDVSMNDDDGATAAADLRAQPPPSFSAPPLQSNQSYVDLTLRTEEQYPTDPFLFKEKPLTPELIRALMEHGPCKPATHSHLMKIKDASVQCGISAPLVRHAQWTGSG